MGKIGKMRSLRKDLRKNYDSTTTSGSSCCTIYDFDSVYIVDILLYFFGTEILLEITSDNIHPP